LLQVSKQLLKGDNRALSRAISLLERGDPQGSVVLREVHPHTGKAYCIGITGSPGAGKSTIIARLTETFREKGASVGIIAVDPTSPYSGGALLGDRIRMELHYLDPQVFIRSMATRGSQGGLSRIIKGAVRLLDAAGKDIVLVETVGVGQTELNIMGVSDTVVVILVPEGGDAIQTLKAGLMEIADIYVVNKADRPRADQMVADIHASIATSEATREWTPPVLAAQAINGLGVEELYGQVQRHREHLSQGRGLEERRSRRRVQEVLEVLEDEVVRKVRQRIDGDPWIKESVRRVEQGELEPYSTALELLRDGPLALDYWLSPVPDDQKTP
jgi:LAO/AO transport system kinase